MFKWSLLTQREEASKLLLPMYLASFRAQKVLSLLLRLVTLVAGISMSLLVSTDDIDNFCVP